MTTPQELLQNVDVFSSGMVSAKNIWDLDYPDVESIHHDAFKRLLTLIRGKQKDPAIPLAVLILGEGGTGKTQLLVRTAKYYSHHHGGDVSLANIKPIQVGSDPIKHLMHNIITDIYEEFKHRPDSPLFKRLLSGMMFDFLNVRNTHPDQINDALNHFLSYHGSEQGEVDALIELAVKWLKMQHISLDQEFVSVLFQVCNPSRRLAAVQWMRGEVLDKDDAQLIGLSVDPETEETRPLTEAKHQSHLITLGILFAKYNQTLLICFDQLELLKEPENHQKLGIMVQTILTQCEGMMPITLSRTTLWNEEIRKSLSKALIELLSPNTITLYGCDALQVEEIIKIRVQYGLPDAWETPYLWLIGEIKRDNALSSQPTPREVIGIANRIIHSKISSSGPPTTVSLSPEKILRQAYDAICIEKLEDFKTSLPEFEDLITAIEVYLSGTGTRFTRNDKVILTATDWCIIVNVGESHSTIGKCFTTGINHLKKHSGGTCVYFTDPRCIVTKSTWEATNRKKEAFEKQGGIIFQPNEKNISRYYALFQLYAEIGEGNILGADNQILNEENLKSFIKNKKCLKPLINITWLHLEKIIHEVWRKNLKECLPIDLILTAGKEKDIIITLDLLQEFCDSNYEFYSLDETCIHIMDYWKRVIEEICNVLNESGFKRYTIERMLEKLKDKDSFPFPPTPDELISGWKMGYLKNHQFEIVHVTDGYILKKTAQ